MQARFAYDLRGWLFPPDPQVNDGGERWEVPIRTAHERLLRKLLAYPNRPAVMELVFYR